MAVAARQENREYYAPVTRVYSHGSTAAAAEPAYRPQPRREQSAAAPQETPRQSRKPQFVLVRYERITDEYAVVNSLKDDIEETNLSLAALNVELQLAVSLEDAKEVAERMGMDYPTADQIRRIEAPLASSAQDSGGAADGLPLQNQG